jgi:hypothetical protein
MTSKVFTAGTVIDSAWLNDVNTITNTDLGGVGGLASTASGKGASLVGINDAGALITATTVEAALQEVVTNVNLKAPKASPTFTGTLTTPNINGGQIAGNRNVIINGDMRVDQRNAGAAQTITAGAALAYTVDQWWAACTGANVTGQRVAGTAPELYTYQFTGAAGVTAIQFAQRIESIDTYHLAGSTATLSAILSNSLLTTVTWTAYYANTGDTFGSLASPTKTQIATGTFTVTSTATQYSVQIAIPAAATTGIEIVFSVAAQTSGTWKIGNVQIELGSQVTPFERRTYLSELSRCQRYYEIATMRILAQASGAGATPGSSIPFQVVKRIIPTMTVVTTALLVNASSVSLNTAGVTSVAMDIVAVGSGNAMATPTVSASAVL